MLVRSMAMVKRQRIVKGKEPPRRQFHLLPCKFDYLASQSPPTTTTTTVNPSMRTCDGER